MRSAISLFSLASWRFLDMVEEILLEADETSFRVQSHSVGVAYLRGRLGKRSKSPEDAA